MTPTDPTPDAIRAAIAETINDQLADEILSRCKDAGMFLSPYPGPKIDGIRHSVSYDEWLQLRRETVKGIIQFSMYRLTQIGAVSAAGTIAVPYPDLQAVFDAARMCPIPGYYELHLPNVERLLRAYRESKALANGADDGVPDPNTPEGGNTPFDPQEWVDEETGVRFTDDDDVPTKAALLDAIGEYARKNRRAHECSTEEYIQSKTESWRAVRALIDRLPIAGGADDDV